MVTRLYRPVLFKGDISRPRPAFRSFHVQRIANYKRNLLYSEVPKSSTDDMTKVLLRQAPVGLSGTATSNCDPHFMICQVQPKQFTSDLRYL